MKKVKKEKAYRWGLNEGVKALREGDVKARLDIASRFPMFATATLEEIVEEVEASFMTVRQVEIRLKKRLFADFKELPECNEVEDPPEENEDPPEDDILESTKDLEEKAEAYLAEHEEPEEVKAEVEETPPEKPKVDIAEDDLDDLFSDME